jgi:hydroxyethylthiazole kinase-like uncharacterized protein yjeF
LCNKAHQSHKGSFGDVWVLGGQQPNMNQAGMVGAAVLAARSSLSAGAGRVHVLTLGQRQPTLDIKQPELMFRDPDLVFKNSKLPRGIWVCGCGRGDAIKPYLSRILKDTDSVVLDADALNWLAQSPQLQQELKNRSIHNQFGVITPHPLEAARLLKCSTQEVMKDRTHAASVLVHRFQVICVLKGSGTIIATPKGEQFVNSSGSGKLAGAGTGDVLAGYIAGHLSRYGICEEVSAIICRSVHLHGHTGENSGNSTLILTASRLSTKLSL